MYIHVHEHIVGVHEHIVGIILYKYIIIIMLLALSTIFWPDKLQMAILRRSKHPCGLYHVIFVRKLISFL